MFCVLYFFFFKQKTAYEMRISDWSSDVCSSDLYQRKKLAQEHEARRRHNTANDPARQHASQAGSAEASSIAAPPFAYAEQAHRHEHHEIGRASCRERVCQYV